MTEADPLVFPPEEWEVVKMVSRAVLGDDAYESEVLAELTVTLPDTGTGVLKGIRRTRAFRDVKAVLLPGGALRVYRDVSVSDAVPFETVFPHGTWCEYNAKPAR